MLTVLRYTEIPLMIIPNHVGTYSYELLIATYLKEINFKKLSAFKTNVFKKSYQKIKITDIVVRSVKNTLHY